MSGLDVCGPCRAPKPVPREVSVSSIARKIPDEVLAHPAVVALIEAGTPTGSVSPEEVRRASEDAAVEPRHLKALLGHLSTLGISVDLGAVGTRAAAAATARKTTSTAAAKKTAAKAAASSALDDAEAPAPAKKTAAKKAP